MITTPIHEMAALSLQAFPMSRSQSINSVSTASSALSSPFLPTQERLGSTSPQLLSHCRELNEALADSASELSDGSDTVRQSTLPPRRHHRRGRQRQCSIRHGDPPRAKCHICECTYGRIADLSRHKRAVGLIVSTLTNSTDPNIGTRGETSLMPMVWQVIQ